jgi:hypothetical protein
MSPTAMREKSMVATRRTMLTPPRSLPVFVDVAVTEAGCVYIGGIVGIVPAYFSCDCTFWSKYSVLQAECAMEPSPVFHRLPVLSSALSVEIFGSLRLLALKSCSYGLNFF